jgi:arylsulfatase A-like enzyme
MQTLLVTITSLVLIQNATAGEQTPPRRPNVLFILVDDMGATDAGYLGSTFYETPNLDRLAKSSAVFTQGYAAAPVCSPTRASILTGKHPARMSTTEWFGGGGRKGQLLPAPYVNHLPEDEVTLAQTLRRAGYRTAHVGKWHLGGAGFDPTRFGFDINIAGNDKGSPKSYFSPYQNLNLPDGPKGEELTERCTTEAIKFMAAAKDKPFFVHLSFHAVHIPLQARKELIAKYQAKVDNLPKADSFAPLAETKVRLRHDNAVYAALVETLDRNIGRLLDALDKLGIAENTIVVFTSDNGGVATSEGWPTSNLPLRAGKGWLYEGGIRVPFLIRWPGRTQPGQKIATPVVSTDFYPTLLAAAGLEQLPKQHVDGVDLTPLLKDAGGIKDRPIFWHYPHYSNQFGRPSSAIRAGDYTLIEFFEDNRVELYDVVKDISQKHDLAKEQPERAAQMRSQLETWRRDVGARLPQPNPAFKNK